MAGEKKLVPAKRSSSISVKPPARKGVATRMMIEVARIAQTKSGICQMLMPGGRIFRIVTMKLTAPRIDEAPIKCRLIAQSVCPSKGLNCGPESGK